MKKILSLALMIGLFASVSTAQEIKYGLKGGINFANIDFSGGGMSASASSVTNFSVHGIVDYAISPGFSIQPGLGISGKGTKFEIGGDDLTLNTLYLEVPVNALAKFNVANAGKFYAGAGPYLGIKLSSKAKMDGETEDLEGWKDTDFGVNLAAGFEFSKGILIGANYGLGLTNIAEDSGDASAKNRVLSFSVGFLF